MTIKSVVNNVMRNRDSKLARYLAKLSTFMLKSYENVNYNFDSNGELRLIQKLSFFNFSVFFDVGANVGKYSRVICQYFQNANIYAFEIVPSTFNVLRKNVKDFSNIKINNIGLSHEVGQIKIKDYGEGSGTNSIYDFPHQKPYEWTICNTTTGDIFCADSKIDEIDFLKIDVEGAEHLVLQGFDSKLREGKIKVIQFEYGYVNILSHFLLADFYKFFDERGYIVGKIYPLRCEFKQYEFQDENFLGPNYIAVRKDLQDIIKRLSSKF